MAPPQMALSERHDLIEAFALLIQSTNRSAYPFSFGLRAGSSSGFTHHPEHAANTRRVDSVSRQGVSLITVWMNRGANLDVVQVERHSAARTRSRPAKGSLLMHRRLIVAHAPNEADITNWSCTAHLPASYTGVRFLDILLQLRKLPFALQRLTGDIAPMDPPISKLMTAAEEGEPGAGEALFAALYSELHRLARRELGRGGGPGVSLGVTTLLHEAYLDISGRSGPSFPDRARFMGYAARVMRGLIIDHARSRHAQKRGGQFVITSLDADIVSPDVVDHRELARISDALEELAKMDSDLATIVDLKFFCGFSFAEIAAMRGTSERTAQRGWEKARIFLHGAIDNAQADQ
jgi:RNA polymerase sigma factor (TIGR02999 family)